MWVPGSGGHWLLAVPRGQGAQRSPERSRAASPEGAPAPWSCAGSLEPHYDDLTFSAGTHSLAPTEVESCPLCSPVPSTNATTVTWAASGWVAPRSGGSVCCVALFLTGRGVLWANCWPTEGASEQAAGSWHSSGLGAGTLWDLLFPLGTRCTLNDSQSFLFATVQNERGQISSG